MTITPRQDRLFDYIVVGAGLTGATFARQKADQGYSVLIYDEREHLAGNAYDHHPEGAPMLVHQYGPHLFHTNSKKVWDYLSQFTEWRPYEHRVQAVLEVDVNVYPVNGEDILEEQPIVVPLPFNFTSIRTVWPEDAALYESELKRYWSEGSRITLRDLKNKAEEVGSDLLRKLYQFVYQHVFVNYTRKMWGMTLEELGPTVADRVPLVVGTDDRYFSDKYQAMPEHGYTDMVRNMLSHRLIEVRLGIKSVPEQWTTAMSGGKMLHTGSIDEFFGYRHGKLPYRGMDFHFRYHMTEELSYQGNAASWTDEWASQVRAPTTVNYPDHPQITRISSMSRALGLEDNDYDVRITEKPTPHGRYYPIPTREARELYARYVEEAEKNPQIRFAGRMGSFSYLNMDQAVAQALKIAGEF